jgi:hypothetical protein
MQSFMDGKDTAGECEIFHSHDFSDFITTINSLTTEYAPHEIYALVDVDYTITVPKHPATHAPNIKTHYADFLKLTQCLNSEEIERFENLALIQESQRLIDDRVNDYLNHLNKNQIKTTAITAMLCGAIEPYTASMIQWRYESLKALNIDFSDSFPDIDQLNLTDIPSYLKAHPQYYKGILCTNGELGEHNKGIVLESFLNQIDYQPKVIVMIDDKLKNLEDVQRSLQKSNTRFIGFDYKAGLHFASQPIESIPFTQFWNGIKDTLI